jgi:peptidoglycan/xylan/chitin deacetylase (PgdA/CDA1 family)
MTSILIIALVPVFAALFYFTLEYSFLVPSPRGLPVLMYHKVKPDQRDGLTVSTLQFERQLRFLQKAGYQSLHFNEIRELLKQNRPLPSKAVVLTFDDAYENFRTEALPLLQKYGFIATVFIPVAYMGRTNVWDAGNEPILDAASIKQMALNGEACFGLHSFLHRNYVEMSVEEMKDDLIRCMNSLKAEGILFDKVLAYPYGGFPKKDPERRKEMEVLFAETGLDFALRIGNRINRWPLIKPYEVKRIDIRGTDTFFVFKTKLRKGRAKLFS